MKAIVLHSEVPEHAGRDELDVLVQAEAVARTLCELGFEPVAAPFTVDLPRMEEHVRRVRPAFVFNLVETVGGSGRLIHVAPAFLDHWGMPYTGSRTEALFLTSNKVVAKGLLDKAGIPTPPWISATGAHGVVRGDALIIKSVWEHASIGIDASSVVSFEDPQGLSREMERRRAGLGGDCFAEAYIEGREFNLSLLGPREAPQVLPPAEIVFVDFPPGVRPIVGYRAKWEVQSFEYTHTVRRFDFGPEDRPLLQRLADLARECWTAFDLCGYARVDFRVDPSGRPWVLEVNANPCLSPDAGFVAACEQAGQGFTAVVERIVQASIPLHSDLQAVKGRAEDGCG